MGVCIFEGRGDVSESPKHFYQRTNVQYTRAKTHILLLHYFAILEVGVIFFFFLYFIVTIVDVLKVLRKSAKQIVR